MGWQLDDITAVELVTDLSDGDLVTIRVSTPVGAIEIMGMVTFDGPVVVVTNTHIQGLSANAVGVSNIRIIAEAVLERIDCDEARIEGAARTTGANPGHRPRVIRFTRRSRDEAR